MSGHHLTLNAGSSSLKFAVYPADGPLTPLATGIAEGLGTAPRLQADLPGGRAETLLDPASGMAAALDRAIALVATGIPRLSVRAVGHRVVHGGPDFSAPVRLDDAMLEALARLEPFAPLHQPHNLAGIRAATAAFPGAPQIACFDTAFHRGHPWEHDTYALPPEFHARGIRRYGFHGLSCEYLAARLAEIDPERAAGRVVIAHLGNGASLTGIRAGQPVASTMGFTATDGLPMGTRSGQIDPGVILHLIAREGMSPAEVSDLLNRRSGLLGLSGLSPDMRRLEAAGTEASERAIRYFTTRIRRETAALAADLGGLDALVFSGGIGARSVRIRQEVTEGLGWLGLTLDPAANATGGPRITTPDSSAAAYALQTDEESVIARAIRSLIPSG